MIALRRVSLAAASASVGLFMAGCGSGVIEVKAPAAETVAPQHLRLEFTATRHWELKRVMLGSEDITDQFQPQSGNAGVVSSANLFLPSDLFPATGLVTPTGPVAPSIRRILEITADLGGGPGDTQAINLGVRKTQELVIEKEVLTIEAPNPKPSDDDSLYLSPVAVKVSATFPWSGLRVTLNDDTGPSADLASTFSARAGPANASATASVDLPEGDQTIHVDVVDAGGFVVSQSLAVKVLKDVRPDCRSTLGCTLPYLDDLGAFISVRVGSSIFDSCGRGTWEYKDGTRAQCRATGGDYRHFNPTPPPPDDNTLCRNGFTRKNVSGKATCVAG